MNGSWIDLYYNKYYLSSMKVKTSITLSEELLKAIDTYDRVFRSRSEFLEEAARLYLTRLAKKETEKRDVEIINRRADALNAEAEDVLTYQTSL